MTAEPEAGRVLLVASAVAVVWRLIGLPFNGMVTNDSGANGRSGVPANWRSYGWADGFLVDG